MEPISVLNWEFLVKNCRQGFCVLWSRAERSLCPARESRKSSKFPRQRKDFHETEGTRVQGNLSCRSSSLPHDSTLWIQPIIKSRQSLKATLLGNSCKGRGWYHSKLFYIILHCILLSDVWYQRQHFRGTLLNKQRSWFKEENLTYIVSFLN